MSPKQKIRTDYHDVLADRSQQERSQQWLKAALVLGLGFLLGMLYQKIALTPSCEKVALNDVNKASVVASKSQTSKKA